MAAAFVGEFSFIDKDLASGSGIAIHGIENDDLIDGSATTIFRCAPQHKWPPRRSM